MASLAHKPEPTPWVSDGVFKRRILKCRFCAGEIQRRGWLRRWEHVDSAVEISGVALLADELNQFAMAVESFAAANRWHNFEDAPGNPERLASADALFKAARRLRERIAQLIPE